MRVQLFDETLDQTVLTLFSELGLDVTNTQGDFGFVYQKDLNVIRVAQNYKNFYPLEVAKKLIRKDLISDFLSSAGFDVLPWGIINSATDLDGVRDFIIKPVLSQGAAALGSKVGDSEFAYKIFQYQYPSSVLNYPGKYLWQRAVTTPTFLTYTISGAINGSGDVWFFRDSKNEKINITGYNIRSRKYNYQEVAHLHPKLEQFIKSQNIRNAAFSAQFLELDKKFYIHDWNFRISNRYLFDMLRGNKLEMKKYFMHMFDIPNDLPETYPDEWIIDCAAEKTGFNLREYYRSSFAVVPT
jgi:hypothetical protein